MEGRSMRRGPRPVVLWSAIAAVLVAVAAGVVVTVNRADGGNKKSTATHAVKKGTRKKKGDKDSPAAPAAPVQLAVAHRGRISTWLQTTATLEPRHAATLVARRAGPVVALAAEEGQWVERGAVLARLDDTEARLAVERAEVGLEMAKREAERGRKMRTQGFLSEREWDDLDLKLRNAKVALDQARYDLSLTRVVAPFAGRVVFRGIQVGETVPEGRECFRIADFSPVQARLYFPERELARVRVGQPAELTVDSRPGERWPAAVTLVNPVVDRTNGTFKVTLEAPNRDGSLRPGGFVRVRLQTAVQGDALLLPRRGLLEEDGERYVYLAKGDSVVRAPVTVGAVEGDQAQILSGLVEGDRVVTIGQGGLRPGAKIRVASF